MKLQTVVDRLAAECPSLVDAKLLSEVHEIDRPELGTPSAFLLRLSDSPQPNEGMGVLVNQPLRRSFAIIIVARSADGSNEPLEDARQEIFAALVGWTPTGQDFLIEYDGGEADSIEGRLVRWRDTFVYTDYLRFQR